MEPQVLNTSDGALHWLDENGMPRATNEAWRPTAAEQRFDAAMLAAATAPQTAHVADWRIECWDIESEIQSTLDAREARWMKSELTTAQARRLYGGEFVSVDGRVICRVDLGRDYVQDATTESRIAARKAERAARPRTEWIEQV